MPPTVSRFLESLKLVLGLGFEGQHATHDKKNIAGGLENMKTKPLVNCLGPK